MDTMHADRLIMSNFCFDEQARRLATYSKRFAIVALNVHNQTQQQIPEKRQCLSTFFKALAYMANLQELYLFFISITNDLLQSAVCLPVLNVLRLEYCGVSESWMQTCLRNSQRFTPFVYLQSRGPLMETLSVLPPHPPPVHVADGAVY